MTVSRTSPASVPWTRFYWTWATQLLSAIGGPFQAIAVSIWILSSGYGPSKLAVVLALSTGAQIVGALAGGPLIDRLGPLRIILCCDVVRCLLSIALAMLIGNGGGVSAVAFVVACNGVANGAFVPALRSVPVFTLAEPQRPRGNSYFSMSDSVSMLVGALAGGVVVSLAGPETAILINAGGFAVGVIGSAVVLLWGPPGSGGEDAAAGLRMSALLEGLTYLRGTRWLAYLFAIDAVMDVVTAGQLGVGLPVIAQRLGGGYNLGLMIAAFGAGSVIGAVMGPWSYHRGIAAPRLIACLHLLQAPFLAAVPLSDSVIVSALCLGAMGALNGVAVVVYMSILQQKIPRLMLGRVLSLLTVAGLSLQPLGQISSGFLIGAGFLIPTFVGASVIMVVTSLVYLRLPLP